MVNLQLSVATSEMANPAATTKIVSDAEKEQFEHAVEGEKMEELRIVIVNASDGVIEHNRYIPKERLNTSEVHQWEEFLVLPGKKRIYLFANENTTRIQAGGTRKKLLDYQFDSFSEETIKNLRLLLTEGISEELPAPLPMCECHEVEVTDASNQQYMLYITRVATKFTYRLTNNTNVDLLLSGIKLSNMSRSSFYLPKGLSYSVGGEMEVSDYEVPNIGTNDYYSFEKSYSVEIEAGAANIDLTSFYLLETKYYKDEAEYGQGDNYYKTSIVLGGIELTGTLTELPYQLPRNTHVVVDIIINGLENEYTDWEVDLLPYANVVLEPTFGVE